MLTHIVLWKFSQENKMENMLRLKAGLEALPALIPEIKSLEFGIGLPGGWDAALLTRFESKEDLETYQRHPEHKKISAYCGSIRTDRAAVDYES